MELTPVIISAQVLSSAGWVNDGMTIALLWSENAQGEHHARRGTSHYVVAMRPDGQWMMSLFSIIDRPSQNEERLGHYSPSSLEEAKQLAQGLADQLPWVVGLRPITTTGGRVMYPAQ